MTNNTDPIYEEKISTVVWKDGSERQIFTCTLIGVVNGRTIAEKFSESIRYSGISEKAKSYHKAGLYNRYNEKKQVLEKYDSIK